MAENLAIVLPFAITAVILIAGRNGIPAGAACAIVTMFLVGLTTWGIMRWLYAKPVKFVRTRDPYFWVSGFDSRFLAQLPEWGTSQ